MNDKNEIDDICFYYFFLLITENQISFFFFFSSRRRHTRWPRDWSSDVCSSDLVATGQPVGSRHLVEQTGLGVSPSTVRNELAELEARGLLTHPHTSAGRVPTERGYRLY